MAIRQDAYRNRARQSNCEIVRLFFTNRNFRPVASLRAYQWLRARPFFWRPARILVSLLHKRFCHAAAIDLASSTPIGPGFIIVHGWGLVISNFARIGSNVTCFHGVTIGRGDRIAVDGSREGGAPVIEDNVWIGPHASIVGAITIGSGSRILAGAFVNFDVAPGTMVGGNPGKIIRTDVPEDVLNKAGMFSR